MGDLSATDWVITLAAAIVLAVFARFVVTWRPDRVWLHVALRYVRGRWAQRLCCRSRPLTSTDKLQPREVRRRVVDHCCVLGCAAMLLVWRGSLC